MGLVIPRPILQWKQPKDFDRMVAASTPIWLRVVIRVFSFTLAIGFCFFLWFSAKSNPAAYPNAHNVSAEKLWAIAIPFAFFMTFGVPWMHALPRHNIRFYDEAIRRNNHQSGRRWKYVDIAHWLMVESRYQGRPLRILVLQLARGGAVTIGVDEKITREQIAEVFAGKNVREFTPLKSQNG